MSHRLRLICYDRIQMAESLRKHRHRPTVDRRRFQDINPHARFISSKIKYHSHR